MCELRRFDLPLQDFEPRSEVRETLEVRPQQEPVLLGGSSGQPLRNARIIQLVQQAGVQELDVMGIEVGGSTPEMSEVEIACEVVQAGDRLDRLRRADASE